MRMRVRGGRKRNPSFKRELNDFVGRIKLIHRFAPAGGGKFDGEAALLNEIERFINDRADVAAWAMAVDFDEIEMRQAIDQPARRHFADPPKIIGVHVIDIASRKLLCALGHAIEHLIIAAEVVDGTEDEIESRPISLDPISSGGTRLRIVIKLDPGPNFDVRIFFTQTIKFIEIDAGMITIVISEGDIANSFGPRRIDPRLQELLSVALDPVTLRMTMVIREKNGIGGLKGWRVVQFITPSLLTRRYGAVMNF